MTELSDLRKALRPTLQGNRSVNGHVPELTHRQALSSLPILPSRTDRLLHARSVQGEDRSARLYELVSLLLEAGASEDAAFVLARKSIWNKFRGRDDEVELIWDAISKHDTNEEPRVRNSNGHGGRHSASTPLGTLLARNVPPTQFAVEGIWERGGKGFWAGEPKTYKSLATTDLAVSLASGTPFLGHFAVAHPGPVLIVQEENTEQIQHARFSRIIRERDMGGKIHRYTSGVLEFTPPSDCPVYCLDRTGYSFANKRKLKTLEREIAGLRPALVIFDPLQMMMGGLSLRNETDVAVVLNWLNYVMESYKTGVLIVHHYHKRKEEGPQLGGQRMLGSQALHAWLSCGMYVQRQPGGRLRVDREFRGFVEHTPFEVEFDAEDDEDIYSVKVHETVKSPKVARIVDLVQERPNQTAEELAETMGVSPRRVRQLADKAGLQKNRLKAGEKGGNRQIVYRKPSATG